MAIKALNDMILFVANMINGGCKEISTSDVDLFKVMKMLDETDSKNLRYDS